MKLIKIFSIVFCTHLLAICFLFVLPGCKTTKGKEPDAADPAVADGGDMGAQDDTKGIHPDFNAGLGSSGSGQTAPTGPVGRYPPTRPSWDFEPAAPADDSPEEVLKPVSAEPIPAPQQSTPKDTSTRMYTVKSGDNLTKIARKFGTTVAAIKMANALESDLIRVNDTLVLPSGSGASSPAPAPKPKPSARNEVSATGEAIHIVVSGDTPSGIARQYGMSTKTFMQINHITDPTKMQIGQRVFVKSQEGATSVPRSASASRTVLEEGRSTTPPVINERERSLLEEEEVIPVIPIDSDEGEDGGSTD